MRAIKSMIILCVLFIAVYAVWLWRIPIAKKHVAPERQAKNSEINIPVIPVSADRNLFHLYIDADFSNMRNSSISIERGIRTALNEVGGVVGDRTVKVILHDHHGNSERSKKFLQVFLNDPNALAIYCGLHSPPVLSNLQFITDKNILLLDPWAAAGPITRRTDKKGRNWIFRLSVDDTKAGEAIVTYACDIEGFKKPGLLLEDTGWGKSNHKTMLKALASRKLKPQKTLWFNWSVGEAGAKEIVNDLYLSGCDVIFFVGNAPEGRSFIKALSMRQAKHRLPIRSHWGITGGEFYNSIGEEILTKSIDLKFLQTRFSFLSDKQSELANKVFAHTQKLFPAIKSRKDIKAPCGFIHAYDLTQIMLQAAKNCKFTFNATENRGMLRVAFEKITLPIEGLIKTYNRPFRLYSDSDKDAHEALGLEDLRMARYGIDGEIRLIKEESK